MDIANTIITVASLITAVGVIIAAVTKIVKKIFEPINEQIEEMDKRQSKQIDGMDERQCRMWLVDFLNDIETGETKDEVQFKFAHELYDHYTNELHKNSYIHDKWDRVMNKK